MNIKRFVRNNIRRVVDHFTGSGLAQEENSTPLGERYMTPGFGEIIRECGAEAGEAHRGGHTSCRSPGLRPKGEQGWRVDTGNTRPAHHQGAFAA